MQSVEAEDFCQFRKQTRQTAHLQQAQQKALAEKVICHGAAFKNSQKTGSIEYLFESSDHPDSPHITSIHAGCRGFAGTTQFVSILYTERLAQAGIEPSVGSRGDSYDNALAETINGLYKAELIHRRAPWKTKEALELATLEWVAWFNHHRLLSSIGYIPPAEAEVNYYQQASREERDRGLNLNQLASMKPGAIQRVQGL